jgi:hypothetical protein
MRSPLRSGNGPTTVAGSGFPEPVGRGSSTVIDGSKKTRPSVSDDAENVTRE